MLEAEDSDEVVAEVGAEPEELNEVVGLEPDLMIVDIYVSNNNGERIALQIKATDSNVKILALSNDEDPESVLKMLRAGAGGYLLKHSSFDDLLKGIESLLSGDAYYCKKITSILLKRELEQK